ncbi:hypothetical protein PR048_015817 [Dryococelus australis]|uniref:PiggyBac transposable element-derived protein domain-containing protein n=1 Tax=Dryococelus australis TaxID=614101 RepID=A0ABQ9HI06_9NEOP|nr:hypothetical protein PR048_015817 [Dryococelus australis]
MKLEGHSLRNGETVLVPRIALIPYDVPFEFPTLQFPHKVCFTMAINKSQLGKYSSSQEFNLGRTVSPTAVFTWRARRPGNTHAVIRCDGIQMHLCFATYVYQRVSGTRNVLLTVIVDREVRRIPQVEDITLGMVERTAALVPVHLLERCISTSAATTTTTKASANRKKKYSRPLTESEIMELLMKSDDSSTSDISSDSEPGGVDEDSRPEESSIDECFPVHLRAKYTSDRYQNNVDHADEDTTEAPVRPSFTRDIDITEVKALFGLHYLAGVLKMNSVTTRELFDKHTGVISFCSIMSHARFEFLTNSLRFDRENSSERRKNDRLAAIRKCRRDSSILLSPKKKKIFTMLSTMRGRKYEDKAVRIPEITELYNATKGGIDCFD